MVFDRKSTQSRLRPFLVPPAQSRFGVWKFLFFLLILLFAATSGQAQVVALPAYESGGVDRFFHLQLETGDVFLTDQLQRGNPRTRLLGENVFTQIGRPAEQKATLGEILLGPIRNGDGSLKAILFVETSTGFLAFFDQPGRNAKFGRISTAVGRPFEPLASAGGNYTLLMRRDGSGRTEGAYLYQSNTGKALYIDGMRKLQPDGAVTPTPELPKLGGQVATAEVQSARGATIGYFLTDNANGALHFFTPDPNVPSRITTRISTINLYDVIGKETRQATPQRLLAVPIENRNDLTAHLLFIDVASGELALLSNLNSPRQTLRKVPRNVYDTLGNPSAENPRTFAAVPQISGSGETTGVWLIDSLTRSVLLITQPAGNITIQRVGSIGR